MIVEVNRSSEEIRLDEDSNCIEKHDDYEIASSRNQDDHW